MKPDGVTIHFIDYSDHYARDNGELSRFNFMTFTERQWQQYNPDLHYVNRLRHSEYIELFINARLKPVIVDATVENVQQEIINKLAPEFRAFSVDDLFTLRAKVVLIPQADVSLQV